MNHKGLYFLMLGLAGCQSIESPEGPCQLPPVYHQLGQQSWRTSGAKTFDDRANCLAKGGQFSIDDPELFQSQIKIQADAGDPEAWIQLGQWALYNQPPNFEDAYRAFQSAYRLGDDSAAWYLSYMHRHGMGRAADSLTAVNWLQKATGDQTLVPKIELTRTRLALEVEKQHRAQLQADQVNLSNQLQRLQAGLVKTRLYRFDLGGSGGCGIDLDWQAFGGGAAGFSLAIDAFERQYAHQGWLWLDFAKPPTAPLFQQVVDEVLQTSNAWLVVTGLHSSSNEMRQPRIIGQTPRSDQAMRHGPSQLRWDCR